MTERSRSGKANTFVPFVPADGEHGDVPCPRHGHTAVIEESSGGIMIVFGGCNDNGVFCSDLYYFSIGTRQWPSALRVLRRCVGWSWRWLMMCEARSRAEERRWDRIESAGIPSGRQYHSAVRPPPCSIVCSRYQEPHEPHEPCVSCVCVCGYWCR